MTATSTLPAASFTQFARYCFRCVDARISQTQGRSRSDTVPWSSRRLARRLKHPSRSIVPIAVVETTRWWPVVLLLLAVCHAPHHHSPPHLILYERHPVAGLRAIDVCRIDDYWLGA